MKRASESDLRKEMQVQQPPSASSELEGLLDLGMKREALRLARRTLKNAAITGKTFNGALNALLTLADKLKPWMQLVESAYARLPKRDRPAVRFFMMSFYSGCSNDEAMLQLMPKSFRGEFGLLELGFVIGAALDLGKAELTKKLARRLPRAIRQAEHPLTRSRLQLCLAECLVREGKWNEAMAIFEAVLSDEVHSRNAVTGIVEIHAVRAWLALRHGLRLIEQFKRDFDPDTAIMLPGNGEAVQEEAATEFKRSQKILERIVPEKRRRELGIA